MLQDGVILIPKHKMDKGSQDKQSHLKTISAHLPSTKIQIEGEEGEEVEVGVEAVEVLVEKIIVKEIIHLEVEEEVVVEAELASNVAKRATFLEIVLKEEVVAVVDLEPASNVVRKAISPEIVHRAEAVVVAIEHASSVVKKATSPEIVLKEVVEVERASIVAKKVTCQEIAQTQEMKMQAEVEDVEEVEAASIEVASIVKMSRWKIQQQQLEDGDQLMVKIMMLHGALLKMREAGILQRTHLMISKPLQVVDGELQKLQNKRNKQVIGIIQK